MSTIAVSPLKLASRRPQDVVFGALYVACIAATACILASKGSAGKATLDVVINECANPLNISSYSPPSPPSATVTGPLLPDLLHAVPYLGASLGFAVLFGVTWMGLLRSFAKPIIYISLVVNGVILIAIGLFLRHTIKSTSCSLTTGNCTAALYPLLLVALGLLYFAWLFCARRRIALTARLLEQAVECLSAHPALFLISGGLLVAKTLVLLLSLAALLFLVLADVAVSPQGDGVCQYSWVASDTYVPQLLYAFVALFTYWTFQFWLCARFFVVSLTTGIWYYENESLAAQEGSLGDKEHTRSPVCASLKAAFSTGFGTIAFSSLVISLCELLKRAARNEARNHGLVGLLIACCFSCVANCIEFLTRFALTYAALTGDSLCGSGRTFLGTCSRHGFAKVLVVDGLAAMTLQFGAFVLSLLVSAITVGLVAASVLDGPAHNEDRLAVLGATAALSFSIAFAVLLFISSLLLNVVDAAYACVVLDIDNALRLGAFHRPAIATAVLQKTNPGYVVVTQPGETRTTCNTACSGAAIGVPVSYAQP